MVYWRSLLRSNKGVTLVEITMVILLIALIFYFTRSDFSAPMKSAKTSQAESFLRSAQNSIVEFYNNNERFPTVAEFNQYSDIKYGARTVPTTLTDPLVVDTCTTLALSNACVAFSIHAEDPWGNPYAMIFDTGVNPKILLVSKGPDQKMADDPFTNPEDDVLMIVTN